MRLPIAALLLALAAPLRAASVELLRPLALPAAPAAAGTGASALQTPSLPTARLALPPGPAPLPVLPAQSLIPGLAPEAAAAPPRVPFVAPVSNARVFQNGVLPATLQSGTPAAARPERAGSSSDSAAEQAAELSRRFDGTALFSTSERGAGGRVERAAYRLPGGETAWVSRALAGGRYEAREHRLERAPGAADAPRASLTARLEDGVLSVRREGGGEAAMDSRSEFHRALAAFGPGVRAVEGGWSGSDLASYNDALRAGASAEEAALTATSVGRWAAAAGFSRVMLPPVARSRMPLFVRPQDVVAGRDGALWRRTRVKVKRGSVLERYESGERTVWLDRRVEGRERLVFEFHGETMGPPGTSADAMAVFSRGKDGKLGEYVRADKALVLDVSAERAAFAAGR